MLNNIEKLMLFHNFCKVIDLAYEYKSCDFNESRCVGGVRWAIISELSEDELLELFGDIVSDNYCPYILLNTEQGAAITKYQNNDAKYKMRCNRQSLIFNITNTELQKYYSELDIVDVIILNDRITELREALHQLNSLQKRRLIKYFFYNKTYKRIAQEEGVSHTAVRKTVNNSIKKLKNILK